MAIEKSLFDGKMGEPQPCSTSIMSLYQALAYPHASHWQSLAVCLVTNGLAKPKRWEI
ncbi:hypothetical protein FORC36_2954 [Vibrio vulnificus]|nr:hypothetical protein FORC9_2926 [Vibrio vulnificus]ANH64805.1 hypothetical protein FORC16_2922 [Vibrio vulnificus]ARN67471.1 hypothetical protein FORC36_2954 [Vibrio vulnificus]